MAKRARTSYGPRAGGSLVDGLFGRVGLAEQARFWRALHAWHRMAGPRIGKHTRAERVRGKTLLVRVATAPWANELTYLRAGLLDKLRATAGAEWIEELRFTIGPLAELPEWDASPALAEPPPPAYAPPPAVDSREVAEALLQVEDAELRAALAELFARANATR